MEELAQWFIGYNIGSFLSRQKYHSPFLEKWMDENRTYFSFAHLAWCSVFGLATAYLIK